MVWLPNSLCHIWRGNLILHLLLIFLFYSHFFFVIFFFRIRCYVNKNRHIMEFSGQVKLWLHIHIQSILTSFLIYMCPLFPLLKWSFEEDCYPFLSLHESNQNVLTSLTINHRQSLHIFFFISFFWPTPEKILSIPVTAEHSSLLDLIQNNTFPLYC